MTSYRYKVCEFYGAGFSVWDRVIKDYVRGLSGVILIRTTEASAAKLRMKKEDENLVALIRKETQDAT